MPQYSHRGLKEENMKTPTFELLLTKMSPTQQSALEELEKAHSDLVWDGGTIDTRPLRVSIKNGKGQSMAAINTREKEAFLRLEFRGRDYYNGREKLDHFWAVNKL